MAPPRKPTCLNGHPRTPENVAPGGECRVCRRQRKAAKCAEKRATRLALLPQRAEARREYQEGLRKRQREALHPSYLNLLIHLKTGLPFDQITEEDRLYRKQLVIQYRHRRMMKQQGGQHGTNSRNHQGVHL